MPLRLNLIQVQSQIRTIGRFLHWMICIDHHGWLLIHILRMRWQYQRLLV